jgi:hypothetical protein
MKLGEIDASLVSGFGHNPIRERAARNASDSEYASLFGVGQDIRVGLWGSQL